MARKSKHGIFLTILFAVISVAVPVSHCTGGTELFQKESLHQQKAFCHSHRAKCLWAWKTMRGVLRPQSSSSLS